MDEPAPHEIIWTLTNGYVAPRCLQAVADGAGATFHKGKLLE